MNAIRYTFMCVCLRAWRSRSLMLYIGKRNEFPNLLLLYANDLIKPFRFHSFNLAERKKPKKKRFFAMQRSTVPSISFFFLFQPSPRPFAFLNSPIRTCMVMLCVFFFSIFTSFILSFLYASVCCRVCRFFLGVFD